MHPFGNVLHEVRVEHGDPNAEAEVWVEGYYETGMQDQAPLGPEAGMAVPAEDGGIDLFVATQWLHIDRKQLAPCLGLPEDKVRLFLAGIGGAFGAREDVSMQIHACMLALHTGRPVKMAYGRAESFVGPRAPAPLPHLDADRRDARRRPRQRPRADPDRRRRVHVLVDRGDLERDDVRRRVPTRSRTR